VLEQSEANDEENFQGQKKKVFAEKQKIAKVNSSPRFFYRHRKSRIHTDFSLNSARKDAISSVSIFTKDYRYILSDNCIKTVENRTRDYQKM